MQCMLKQCMQAHRHRGGREERPPPAGLPGAPSLLAPGASGSSSLINFIADMQQQAAALRSSSGAAPSRSRRSVSVVARAGTSAGCCNHDQIALQPFARSNSLPPPHPAAAAAADAPPQCLLRSPIPAVHRHSQGRQRAEGDFGGQVSCLTPWHDVPAHWREPDSPNCCRSCRRARSSRLWGLHCKTCRGGACTLQRHWVLQCGHAGCCRGRVDGWPPSQCQHMLWLLAPAAHPGQLLPLLPAPPGFAAAAASRP